MMPGVLSSHANEVQLRLPMSLAMRTLRPQRQQAGSAQDGNREKNDSGDSTHRLHTTKRGLMSLR